MSVAISSVNSYPQLQRSVSFAAGSAKQNQTKSDTAEQNPVSRKGETMNIVKATFIGGLALGGRLLFELFDSEFLFEHAEHAGTKLVDKNKAGLSASKRTLYRAGATVGILMAAVSGFALLYTMLNTPKIAYKSKVETFKKQKEMDVYIKANEAEKGIYTELGDKAKDADEIEREKLREQYMQMKMAKNQVPDFIKLKR